MPIYRIDITQLQQVVIYLDAPNANLALARVLMDPNMECDDSQSVTTAMNAEVAETDDDVMQVQGANGPVLVAIDYYDALKAQEEDEEEFVNGSGDAAEQFVFDDVDDDFWNASADLAFDPLDARHPANARRGATVTEEDDVPVDDKDPRIHDDMQRADKVRTWAVAGSGPFGYTCGYAPPDAVDDAVVANWKHSLERSMSLDEAHGDDEGINK